MDFKKKIAKLSNTNHNKKQNADKSISVRHIRDIRKLNTPSKSYKLDKGANIVHNYTDLESILEAHFLSLS